MLANFGFANISIFDSAQANTARSRIFREYLRENEFLSKTILACLSGAQMASIHEIKNGKKSRDTAPLRRHNEVTPYFSGTLKIYKLRCSFLNH